MGSRKLIYGVVPSELPGQPIGWAEETLRPNTQELLEACS